MARQSRRRTTNDDAGQEMPLWASTLINKFDSYSSSVERSLTQTFDRVFTQISSLQKTQNAILERLSELESKIVLSSNCSISQQGSLYSAMIKVRADSSKIEEKMTSITWVGIDEKVDEESTRRFDQEIIREAVLTPGNEDLIRELEAGRITSHRHPVGKPRGPPGRGRIIKIRLANQELRDALLSHMRSGRQSLTEQFVHSFARRDYTMEELKLDRALRKRAGDLNALEGKLVYIVRDFDIVKLKYPRELPRHLITGSTNSSNSSSATNSTRVTTRAQARMLNHSSFTSASHNQTATNDMLLSQVVQSQPPCSSPYLA